MTILRYALAVLVLLGVGLSAPAYADGTHGVKVTGINRSDKTVMVFTYNGNDKDYMVPHRIYKFVAGARGPMKGHGKGKGRIFITAASKDKAMICIDENGDHITDMAVHDGETLTISFC